MSKEKKYLPEDFQKEGKHEFIAIGGTVEPYIASKGLVEAMNLAIFLQRPLLLKGEPGSGKTRFAKALAYELYNDQYKDYFEEWHIKSTTRAKDGLYTFNYVDRLRDAQIYDQLPDDKKAEVLDASHYVEFGPLGKSFYFDKKINSEETPLPMVVLIDEIDKADIDFPNDLLLELDEMRFKIDEVKTKDEDGNWDRRSIEAPKDYKPIIIITSNDEKALPDAFLRRCLFYHIEFPTPQILLNIIKAHFIQKDEDFIKEAVTAFYHLRDVMAGDEASGKKVSTSELIDWFRVLSHRFPEAEIAKKELLAELPFSSVLLKSFKDHEKYLVNKEHLNKPKKDYFEK